MQTRTSSRSPFAASWKNSRSKSACHQWRGVVSQRRGVRSAHEIDHRPAVHHASEIERIPSWLAGCSRGTRFYRSSPQPVRAEVGPRTIPIWRPRLWLCLVRRAWPRFGPFRSARPCWSCPWHHAPSASIRPRAFDGPGIWPQNPPAAQQRGRLPFGSWQLRMWTSRAFLSGALFKIAENAYRYRVPVGPGS